jgi:type VI secretion system protein ImpJ
MAVQLAGELATFTHPNKRTFTFLEYIHDDLKQTFKPVMDDLRQSLSMVIEENAIQIPLEERKFGIRVAVISDRELLKRAVFVLAVNARVAPEVIRSRFPSQAKLGPVEKIRDLVNLALPGIALRALPVVPRQIPYHAGFTYFELDRHSEYWKQLESSGGFAMQVAGEFPGLELEFWAIKG